MSSKQIGHTNEPESSTGGVTRSRIRETPDFVESSVDWRVERREVPDWACRDERVSGCFSGISSPALISIDEALSIYFSIRRSLFQLKYRSSSTATLG